MPVIVARSAGSICQYLESIFLLLTIISLLGDKCIDIFPLQRRAKRDAAVLFAAQQLTSREGRLPLEGVVEGMSKENSVRDPDLLPAVMNKVEDHSVAPDISRHPIITV